jgi:hypothetical protein
MNRQTPGDALAGQLAGEGVEVVFAAPGVLLDWAMDHAGRGGPTLIEARVGVMPSPLDLLRLMPPPFASGRPAPANPLGEPQRAN